jgi:hypothetical protein
MTQKRISMTESKLADIKRAAFENGKVHAESLLKVENMQLKNSQITAINKLIEEAGRVMSRAGYMLGKLNGDNSR